MGTMKTVKSIDVKSFLIGMLLASTILLGMAATGPTDQWDKQQEWIEADFSQLKNIGQITSVNLGKRRDGAVQTGWKITGGWEPYGDGKGHYRKRIK